MAADQGSELQRVLAKRRGIAEEVTSAGYHSEGPVASSTAAPPWLAAAASMGVSFSKASPSERPPVNPPWLAAAAESGVVFYDPEGREIEVPVSKVPAFNEGLDKVRDFENSWHMSKDAPDVRPATSSTRPATETSVPACRGSQCEAPKVEPEVAGKEEAAQRDDLKAFVQKRYFALLREGLEPNEAAAQAIIQARSQLKEAEATALNSRSSQKSCSSSAQEDEKSRQQRQAPEEVTVVG
eukprot:TRINITY_DN18166_c0_g2_i1.p1 TRINITY_DN18166_c0_g2~~TRINITY_DN18166_c0_g2_i1.p1  ORF type:complete len:240 (-),score=67.03 TRINITY_DN18166_c0_g2_i1:55-774(-)